MFNVNLRAGTIEKGKEHETVLPVSLPNLCGQICDSVFLLNPSESMCPGQVEKDKKLSRRGALLGYSFTTGTYFSVFRGGPCANTLKFYSGSAYIPGSEDPWIE